MKRPVSVFVLVACGFLAIASAQQPAPPPPPPPAPPAQPPAQLPTPPQFEAHADVVLVDVSVVSGNGDPVTGLTAADFSLEVNGKPRSVHTVQFISSLGMKTAPEVPRLAGVSSNDGPSTGRLLLFVIDENYLRVGSARAVLRTAERVMAKLPAGDLVGLARLPTGRGGVEFTTDRARIRRALSGTMGAQPSRSSDRVRLGEAHAFETNDLSTWKQVEERECGAEGGGVSGLGAAMVRQACIDELEAQAKFVIADASARTRMSISSFEQLSQQLALVKAPVNIVLLSEGLYVGRDHNDLINLSRLAAQARISFFVVQPDESIFDMDSPRTVGGLPQESALAEGLEQLAGFTRGSYYKVSTSGDGAFDRIARELTGYYLLSFEPTDADKASRDRKIKVEVKRRGLTVRARSTYALTDTADTIAALPPLEQVKSLLEAPLPTAGLKMRVATYSVANPQDERVRVIVSAEIGEAATEAAEWPVGIVVANSDGKIFVNSAAQMKLAPASDRTETARLFLMSVVLDPGEYTLRLAAADGSGAAGSVHHTISARLPQIGGDSVRASDLILSPMVPAGEPPRPVPSSVLYNENMAAVLELASSDAEATCRLTCLGADCGV